MGLASRTLKPLGLVGQNFTRNLNINDPMSSRERVGDESLSAMPNGRAEGKQTGREGGREGRKTEVTRGYVWASSFTT